MLEWHHKILRILRCHSFSIYVKLEKNVQGVNQFATKFW